MYLTVTKQTLTHGELGAEIGRRPGGGGGGASSPALQHRTYYYLFIRLFM